MAGNDYLTQIVTRILIYGILVLSVEMCWGQTGIFTFGQAALFGIGGYVVGLVTTKSTVTDIGKLLLIAVIAGALVGLVLGIFLFSGSLCSLCVVFPYSTNLTIYSVTLSQYIYIYIILLEKNGVTHVVTQAFFRHVLRLGYFKYQVINVI